MPSRTGRQKSKSISPLSRRDATRLRNSYVAKRKADEIAAGTNTLTILFREGGLFVPLTVTHLGPNEIGAVWASNERLTDIQTYVTPRRGRGSRRAASLPEFAYNKLIDKAIIVWIIIMVPASPDISHTPFGRCLGELRDLLEGRQVGWLIRADEFGTDVANSSEEAELYDLGDGQMANWPLGG